jgi:hypothetical protein
MDIHSLNIPEIRTLNILPEVRLRRLNNIEGELPDIIKKFNSFVKKLNIYTSQLQYYDSNIITYNNVATRIRNYLAYYLENNPTATFNNNNFELRVQNDARITLINTWCERNKIDHLIDDFYYIKFDDEILVIGKKTDDNVVNFNPNLRGTFVPKLREKIEIINNEKEKLQEHIKRNINEIKGIYKEQKVIDNDIIERNNDKIIKIKKKIQRLQEQLLEQKQNKNILNMANTKKEQDILIYKTYMTKLINQIANIYSP